METLNPQLAVCGVASRPLGVPEESGDACVLKWGALRGLVAVVDGLGHGPGAAAAARTALEILQRASEEPPQSLLRRCHAAARGTRGLAMSIASFDGIRDEMTWLGVGNVRGVLLRADAGGRVAAHELILGIGVVGDQLRSARPSIVPLRHGDVVVVATDGVRGEFWNGLPVDAEPQPLAERILEEHAARDDDALVTVVRYRKGVP